ncbi:MAG: SNF2-related protein [Bacteroidota bacterium]
MAKFGQTWWGENWLNALSNIDYSNRLPRGRAYAGNGSVKDITIRGNAIHAKVQGSRVKPYDVTCEIPEFSKKEKEQLMDEILSNPMILSGLINQELPVELHDIAQKNGIKIFPESWKDIRMDCSCPDWAVPCKHIAAVIYIIANEIDKNPFAVFNLHGLDILAEIEKSGFVNMDNKAGIPQTKNMIHEKAEIKTSEKSITEKESIDFSKIPELKNDLLSLLDDKTIFASANFKPFLKKAYNKTSREIEKYMEIPEDTGGIDFFSEYEKYRNAKIIISNNLLFNDTILYGDKDEMHFSKEKGFRQLVDYLQAIPGKYTDRLSTHLKAIHTSYRFSLILLKQCAYIPQILKLEKNTYRIRQIPALINAQVEDSFDKMLNITPENLIEVSSKSQKVKYLEPREQLIMLTSLFLNHFVSRFYGSGLKDYSPQIEIQRFFFDNELNAFNQIGEKGIPEAIYKWLGNFYLSSHDFTPVIKVDEADNNQFVVSLHVDNTKDSGKNLIPLNKFLEQKKYINHRFTVLEALNNLSNHFTDLKTVIAASGKKELLYNNSNFTAIFFDIIPKIKLLGIKVLLPKSLKYLARPKASLSLQTSDSDSKTVSFLDLESMLDFDWTIALGDKQVSVEEFKKIVKNYSGIVKIKDQYVHIDSNEVQKLLNNLENKPELNSQELLKTGLSEEYESAKISISPKAKKIIQELFKTEKVDIPKDLCAELRHYQENGYQWLYKNSKAGFGSIIADDMGLGKTIQVISAILKFKAENKLTKNKGLIIVPTTLITNWTEEIAKFAPDLKAGIYHGPARKLELNDIDVIITTYGIIRSDVKIFSKKKWAFVVIDEAQNIKNPSTSQTKAVKKLKSPVKIAMTGTPVENRLREYWSIFDFVNKKYLGSVKYFNKEFAQPIEHDRDQDKLEKFKTITSPFIIRREKTDKNIISDLPDKIQNDKYVSLTEDQTAIYKNVVDNMFSEIKKINPEDTIKRGGMVLKLMTALKQICNHPAQFLKKDDFTPELSGKTMMLLNLLEKIYENNEKVLIFTQYKEMGGILENIIYNAFKTKPLFLHGGTPRKKRDLMVSDFQNKPHVKTFILSIKAGGTGLNLTAASNVIHYDLWWNPAVENQATDRAFRIGQRKNVMVYRMISKNSFEEKINAMINHKKEIAALSVAKGEKWIGELSDNELHELIKL